MSFQSTPGRNPRKERDECERWTASCRVSEMNTHTHTRKLPMGVTKKKKILKSYFFSVLHNVKLLVCEHISIFLAEL